MTEAQIDAAVAAFIAAVKAGNDERAVDEITPLIVGTVKALHSIAYSLDRVAAAAEHKAFFS